MPAAPELTPSETIARLARDAGPAVVGLRGRARRGSGVVIAQDRVLTLGRNVRREGVTVAFSDGTEEQARVLGLEHDLGVALIEVPTREVQALSWRDSEQAPAIGAPVFALGNPGGRGLRVTAGAVTSSPRSLRGPRGRVLDGLIEHTAPLPRGSGGGPLLDGEGKLLGLNAIRADEGLIVALPAAATRSRTEDLAAGRRRPQRRLGIAIVPPRAARRLRRAVGLPERDGVLVRGVLPASRAAEAGLERGDLIVALNGEPVDSVDALFGALERAPLDGPFAVALVRGEQELELQVSLEER